MNELVVGNIRTFEDLEIALREIIRNPQKATSDDLEKLKNLEIEPLVFHISDKDHEHAINAELLRTFVTYQDLIYRAIRIVKYGSYNGRLSDEDKVGFSLYISFSEGSIFGDLDLNAIIKAAVEKMNGWQVFGAFAIGVLIVSILSGFKTWSNNERIVQLDYIKMQEEVSDNQKDVDLAKINAKTIESITKLATEATENTSKVLDCLASINGKVEINGVEYSRAELSAMARENREEFYVVDDDLPDDSVEQRIVSGKFLVSRIDFKVEEKDSSIKKRSVNLLNVENGEVLNNVPISGKELTEEQRKMILEAVDGKLLDMTMSVAYDKFGEIKSILLLSCNGESFMAPELF